MWRMTTTRDRMRRLQTEPERGAVAVLVGVLIVALIGFVGLAVDGGGAYAKHQELQNGADAAALAAAQECAKIENDSENECSANAARVEAVADQYGEANVRDGIDETEVRFPSEPNHVETIVRGTKDHWFMPVVGIDASQLSASATAEWGPPNSGPSLPIAVSGCEFRRALDNVDPGEPVDIYLPGPGREQECPWNELYPSGGFGWLETGEDNCIAFVVVGEPSPSEPGVADKTECIWSTYVGQKVLVPIFEAYNEEQGRNGAYIIEQFAAMEILGIRPKHGEGGDSQVGEPCVTNPPNGYRRSCIRGVFIEYTTSADGYELDGPGESTVTIIRLTK